MFGVMVDTEAANHEWNPQTGITHQLHDAQERIRVLEGRLQMQGIYVRQLEAEVERLRIAASTVHPAHDGKSVGG